MSECWCFDRVFDVVGSVSFSLAASSFVQFRSAASFDVGGSVNFGLGAVRGAKCAK